MPEQNDALKPDYILEVIARRRWYLILPFCLAMIAGIVLVFVLPKMYKAETLILIEPQRVPQDYVQSLVSTDIEARISTISQQIMSRTNLERIIREFNLFAHPKAKDLFMEDKVENLRKRIEVNITKDRRRETEAFAISFKDQDPQIVTRVVNGLASYFIEENLKVREAHAIGTSDFLDAEMNTMRIKLERVEEELKNYRERFMGELPEQLETNLRILDRLQQNLNDRQESLREARNRLAVIENQISIIQKQPTEVAVGPGPVAEGPATLERLRRTLEDLLARYTERHPDVLRLKKQIADMEADQKAAAETAPAEVPVAPRGRQAPGLEIVRQREDTKAEISGLEADIAQTQTQINFYQKRVEDTPKREQELLSLRRDYENIQSSYKSLLNRKLEAEIAVNMEKKQQGEQFRVIDPARVPQKPSDPDMRKLFLLVVAAGLGLGGGIVFLLEYADSSFRKPEEVEAALGLSVLAMIPVVTRPADRFWQRSEQALSWISMAVAAALLAGFAAFTLVGVEQTMEMVRRYVSL